MRRRRLHTSFDEGGGAKQGTGPEGNLGHLLHTKHSDNLPGKEVAPQAEGHGSKQGQESSENNQRKIAGGVWQLFHIRANVGGAMRRDRCCRGMERMW